MARERRPDHSAPAGASPIGAKTTGGRGRLIGLILGVIVIIALLALLLSRCGSDTEESPTAAASSAGNAASSSRGDASSTAASSSAAGTATATVGTTAPPVAGPPGAVTSAGGQSVLDLAGSADPATPLAAVSGQPVTGTGVQVLSVPADEGFWVGTSDTARVWVQLTGGGESGYQVTAGDLVDFTGTLVAHDNTFAQTVGVDDTEGAAQLSAQAQHVEVAKDAVTLSAP